MQNSIALPSAGIDHSSHHDRCTLCTVSGLGAENIRYLPAWQALLNIPDAAEMLRVSLSARNLGNTSTVRRIIRHCLSRTVTMRSYAVAVAPTL